MKDEPQNNKSKKWLYEKAKNVESVQLVLFNPQRANNDHIGDLKNTLGTFTLLS